jgi:hypothetical protein
MVNHLKTTSQAGQDMFAHYISGRIHNGSFVDIGCHDGITHSNSYGLEHMGWVGVLVDYQVGICTTPRRNPIIYSDAMDPSPELLEAYRTLPPQLGYLSVDCDGGTWEALKRFPLDKVQCQSITVEHDRYRMGDAMRDLMREYLKSLGYDLVCADVVAPGYGQFEDWWAHPRWSSSGVRNHIRCEGKLFGEMHT